MVGRGKQVARHCWVIEVPTTRGGWRIEEVEVCLDHARLTLADVKRYYPDALIVKYTPEAEEDE